MLSDTLLYVVLGFEALNFALLGYVVWWTVGAGKRFLGSIERSLHLQRGTGGTLLDQARDFLGKRTGKAREETTETGGDEGIAAIAQKFGVSPDIVSGLIEQFTGGGGAAQGPPQNPLMALASKALGGGLKKEDVLPMLPALLNSLKGAGQQGSSSRGEFW